MIRPATFADTPAAVRMAKNFHDMTPVSDLQFSAPAAATMFRGMVGHPDCMAAVLEAGGRVSGCIAAQAQRYPLGDALIAREVVFWIDPPHRGRWARPMLAYFEEWARAKGAVKIGLSCFDDGRTGKLFDRFGYRRTEINFLKDM